MRINKFRFDNDTSVNGVWFNGPDGLRLKVARANNVQYRDFMDAKMRPMVRSSRMAQLDETAARKDLERLDVEAHARFVIKDWGCCQDENGDEIPFSVEKAIELFTEMPDFLQLVRTYSLDLDAFRSGAKAESQGN